MNKKETDDQLQVSRLWTH